MRALMALVAAAAALGAPCRAQEVVFEGNVVGALMLDAETVAVAEADRVYIIPLGRGRRITLDGPFTSVARLVRGPDGGLVVWDDSLYAAFTFDDDGDEGRTVTFSKPGMGGGEVDFVALLEGGVGLFGEVDIGNAFAPSAGPSRNPVSYTTIAPDGTRRVAGRALGKERVVQQLERGMAGAPVIFGHQVFAVPVDGKRFVVAQTDEEEAVVLDADGTQVGTIPMPPFPPAVSRDQIEQERARLIASRSLGRLEDLLRSVLPPDQFEAEIAKIKAISNEAFRTAPANPIPPRISDLRVDSSGRVWMRRFVAPGYVMATWEVRPLDGGQGRTVELSATWVVFDMRGDRMLVGVRDESGAVTSVWTSASVRP